MNYSDSGTVTTTGKSTRFSPAARALVLGLALLLPGAAALAGDPIPGVDVKLGKNPRGSIIASAPTGADGAYQFNGLAPGNYDLFVGGQRVQTIAVGNKGTIRGVLSSDGGKASITFNGQVGVVPDLPSAPVSVTRSNKKAGVAVGDVNRDGRAEIRAVPPKTDGTGKPQFKVADNESPRPTDRAFLDGNASPGIMTGAGASGGDKLPGLTGEPIVIGGIVIVSRAASPKGGDEKPGGSDMGAMGNLSSGRITGVAVDPSDPGGTKTEGSHTITATYSGDANFTPAPKDKGVLRNVAGNSTWTGPILLSKAGDSTKGGVPQKELTGNPANNPPAIAEANSAMGEVSTTRGTAPRPDGGDGKLPSNRVDAAAGQRIAEAGGRAGGIGGVDDKWPDGNQRGIAAEGSNIKATGNVSTTWRRIGRPGALVGDETAPGIVGDPIPGVDYPVNPRPSRKITDNESQKPTDRGIRVEVGGVDGDGRDELSTGHAPKKVSPGTGPHRSLKAGEPQPEDVRPGISDQGTVGGLISYGTAPPPKDGGGKLPGIAGDPVPGTSVGLDHDPGGPISSTKTDENGAFQFTEVPAGKYTLKLPGLPAKSVTIGDDGTIDGKVERGNDGKINVQIFLNTNITKAATIGVDSSSSLTTKASGNPVPGFPGSGFPGIGIGNVMGGILPGMGPSAGGPGVGAMSPAASPMGPGGPTGASPMGPGAGAIRR